MANSRFTSSFRVIFFVPASRRPRLEASGSISVAETQQAEVRSAPVRYQAWPERLPGAARPAPAEPPLLECDRLAAGDASRTRSELLISRARGDYSVPRASPPRGRPCGRSPPRRRARGLRPLVPRSPLGTPADAAPPLGSGGRRICGSQLYFGLSSPI